MNSREKRILDIATMGCGLAVSAVSLVVFIRTIKKMVKPMPSYYGSEGEFSCAMAESMTTGLLASFSGFAATTAASETYRFFQDTQASKTDAGIAVAAVVGSAVAAKRAWSVFSAAAEAVDVANVDNQVAAKSNMPN